MGNPERLYNTIVKRKLSYFGHITRREGENLEKVIMQGKVDGKRGKGRPERRWIDGIKEVTDMTWKEMNELCLNREIWKCFVYSVTRD
eukprot:gene5596-6283_t